MLIQRLHPVQLIGALLTATLAMACATPASFTPVATSEHPSLSVLPELEAGQGRIVLYRKARAEGPSHALTMIDSESTFDIRPGRFAHSDVWPGEHVVDVVLVKKNYSSVSAGSIGSQLGKRVQSHRLYGKPLRVEIRAGETTYVEVAAAGVGVTGGTRVTTGQAHGFGVGSRSGEHFVTLTPDYHSATQVRGLRYRVLFPTLVHSDAGRAQSALRLATQCGPECNVSPRLAELATRAWRGPRQASNALSSSSPDGLTEKAQDGQTGSDEVVSVPAAPYFD